MEQYSNHRWCCSGSARAHCEAATSCSTIDDDGPNAGCLGITTVDAVASDAAAVAICRLVPATWHDAVATRYDAVATTNVIVIFGTLAARV